MKKAAKGLIGLSAALVVLGGGLAALKLTEPGGNDESSETSSEAYGSGTIIIEDKEIEKVEVDSVNDKFTVVVENKKTEKSAATYTLKGYENLPLSTSMIGTIANNVKGLAATSIVADDCTEIEKYGFDEPQASADIYFESGEVITLLIGDKEPSSSADTYIMLEGDDTVYTVTSSKVANYTSEITDFVSSTILEEPAHEDYPIVKSLKIEREDIDYDIVLKYDELSDDDNYQSGTSAVHYMAEPTEAYLTVENSTPITHGMFGLYSSDILCLLPEESDIESAGLSKPFCTVTMNCDNGKEYRMIMSEAYKDENGTLVHNVMLDGTDIIYTVTVENAKWGTVMPIDITSRMVFGTNVWNISEMTVTGKDIDKNVFKIKKKNDVEETTSLSSEDFDVTRNGTAFDTERYRTFYAFLVKALAEEFALDEPVPDKEPIVSVTFDDSYIKKVRTIEFYEYSTLKSLIVINGESKYFCPKSYADTIVENVKRIETGEEYLTTWK